MSDIAAPMAEQPAPWWRSGKIVVLGIAVALVIGWFFYRQTVPPAWLHDFGADIALRASADPDAAPPVDAREETPRGLADNPLICMKNLVQTPWDRVVFVTFAQAKTLDAHPTLSNARWSGLAAAQRQLGADDRYQLVVLLNANAVIDSQVFFTFWADLSGLARSEGFTPETAIFTARSLGGHYVLEPAPGASLASCPSP